MALFILLIIMSNFLTLVPYVFLFDWTLYISFQNICSLTNFISVNKYAIINQWKSQKEKGNSEH